MHTNREIIRTPSAGYPQVSVVDGEFDHIGIEKGVGGIESTIYLTTQDAQALLIVLGERIVERQGSVQWTRMR